MLPLPRNINVTLIGRYHCLSQQVGIDISQHVITDKGRYNINLHFVYNQRPGLEGAVEQGCKIMDASGRAPTDIEQLLLQPLDCLQACMCSVQK